MRVIGTAGHVDHGKSTLVQALTGIHPDRLKEEQEREMTIDLGFAWMTLPDGEEVGIVDVPGHRDFIENMLAGVGGIDAALFVVAADEGVMPQTREHLAILDLLNIQSGVVALTKIDLISEPGAEEWLELVENDLRQLLKGTVLDAAPIVPVSARTRQGLQELLQALVACLSSRPARPDLNRPRLPIDRVFSIAGFGTVVTGTLTDGSLRVGEEIEILPQGLRGRVRGLQSHKKKENVALPGSRTAINISGVDLQDLQRGDVVVRPGTYQPTSRLDVHFRLLADASSPLKHNTEVKLFLGAAERLARVRLLGAEELKPGQEGWLQLELTPPHIAPPIVASRGDRFILRRPSPGETIGGGSVVDPHPKGRHKRFSAETLSALEALSRGTPADILLQALLSAGVGTLAEVIKRSNLSTEQITPAIAEVSSAGLMLNLSADDPQTLPVNQSLVISKTLWERLTQQLLGELQAYHQSHPLRLGMPREELKSRLAQHLPRQSVSQPLSQSLFNAILKKLGNQNLIRENGPLVALPEHQVTFTPTQEKQVQELLRKFAEAPYSPPSLKESQTLIGEELVAALIDLGQLVLVPPDVLFRRQDYETLVAEIRTYLQANGSITVAQARDLFNTSRRYILALMEHLDTLGVTVRTGDIRQLRSR